ncbi:hypothetical protein THAOC_17348, partial [Thalassiosira oceanica]
RAKQHRAEAAPGPDGDDNGPGSGAAATWPFRYVSTCVTSRRRPPAAVGKPSFAYFPVDYLPDDVCRPDEPTGLRERYLLDATPAVPPQYASHDVDRDPWPLTGGHSRRRGLQCAQHPAGRSILENLALSGGTDGHPPEGRGGDARRHWAAPVRSAVPVAGEGAGEPRVLEGGEGEGTTAAPAREDGDVVVALAAGVDSVGRGRGGRAVVVVHRLVTAGVVVGSRGHDARWSMYGDSSRRNAERSLSSRAVFSNLQRPMDLYRRSPRLSRVKKGERASPPGRRPLRLNPGPDAISVFRFRIRCNPARATGSATPNESDGTDYRTRSISSSASDEKSCCACASTLSTLYLFRF